MKIYSKNNVYEEALKRIEWIYNEFDKVFVSYSGGKDSSVIFNLALLVATKMNKLPLHVLFLDQEAEWTATIEEVKAVMYHKDVEPYWYQVPIRIFNATSPFNPWLYCWEEGAEWMRDKDPIAITVNDTGTDRFHEFFYRRSANEAEEKGIKVAEITGMRTEESPNRFAGLTQYLTYKDVTWGRKNDYSKNAVALHPIFDWSYIDVWKAIHDNGWRYNKVYDYQYQHGVQVNSMRVSNLHHETAVHSLFYLQEVEPDTYNKLTKRMGGIDFAGKFGSDDYFVKELPFMFRDWREYRDYLLENLIQEEDKRESFRRHFEQHEQYLDYGTQEDSMFRTHISAILANDYLGAKLNNARSRYHMTKRTFQLKERKRIENEILEKRSLSTAR